MEILKKFCATTGCQGKITRLISALERLGVKGAPMALFTLDAEVLDKRRMEPGVANLEFSHNMPAKMDGSTRTQVCFCILCELELGLMNDLFCSPLE